MWNPLKKYPNRGKGHTSVAALTGIAMGVAITLPFPSSVMAQTAQPTQATGTAQTALTEAVPEVPVFSAASTALTELIEQQATPIKLSFKTINDLPSDVSADGVSINGYSQYVDVEGQKVGQVIITGLEKDGRTATLDPNSFNAQFDLDEPTLTTEQKLDIKGDREALIAALRLLGQEPEEEEKEEEKVQTTADQQTDSAKNAATNEAAEAYETPERVAADPDPVIGVETTSEGCSVRVDYPQQIAVQQSKTVYFEDGVKQSEDECSDSEVRFPLQKSYEVCKDDVDLTALTATAKYTWYYVDQGQSRQDVSDCEADTEKVFPIVEKQSCSVDLDFEKEQAVIQTALVYKDINGLENKVRDCEASISIDPLPLVLNTETCSLKHNFANGTSEQMGTWVYEFDGVIYQATLCTNTDVTYTHEKAYKTTGGTDLCTFAVDLPNGKAIPHYRIQITVDGIREYISECTPDEAGALNIASTTDGCMDPVSWDHDVLAGISYGTERFYYENPNRVYVTECIKSDVTYAHSLKTTGWQNHDDVKAAYPLSTVSINLDGRDFEVASSQVLPGATLIPYTFETTREDVVGNSYTGCSVVRTTNEVEVYKRPDDTDYVETLGPGTPIGPMNACTVVLSLPEWTLVSEREYDGPKWYNGDQARWWITHYREGVYTGSRTVQREDGQQFTQTSVTTPTGACGNVSARWKHGYPAIPPCSNPRPVESTWTLKDGKPEYWNTVEGW